jgi:hypothetical protein
MRQHRSVLAMALALATIAALENGITPLAGAAELPEAVLQALRSNALALNPLTVSWTQERSSSLPLEKLLQDTKQPDEKALFNPQDVTLSYQGGAFLCFRKYTEWEKRSGEFFTWYSDCRFDGQALYDGNSMNRRPLITVEDLNYARTHYPNAKRFFAEYLVAAGFQVHNRNATIERPPESELLYLLDSGGQVSNVHDVTDDSNTLLAVDVSTSDGRARFLLDPAMRYAVHRTERFNQNNELTQTTVNSQFVELPSPHVWLPEKSQVSDYTWWTIAGTIAKTPFIVTDFHVTKLSQELKPPDQFAIALKPGTLVADSRPQAATMPGAILTKDGTYSYRLAPTAEDIASAVAVSQGRRGLVWIICTALVAAILGALILRKRRSQLGAG